MPLWVAQEAYSHEVSSAGFWPGGEAFPEPIFYSYAYPTPEGFSETRILPDAVHWIEDFGEFVLPYEVVRQAEEPDVVLLNFLQSTFDAASNLAEWDLSSWQRRHFPTAVND